MVPYCTHWDEIELCTWEQRANCANSMWNFGEMQCWTRNIGVLEGGKNAPSTESIACSLPSEQKHGWPGVGVCCDTRRRWKIYCMSRKWLAHIIVSNRVKLDGSLCEGNHGGAR